MLARNFRWRFHRNKKKSARNTCMDSSFQQIICRTERKFLASCDGNELQRVGDPHTKCSTNVNAELTLQWWCSTSILFPLKLEIDKSFLKFRHSWETCWTPSLLKRRRNLNCVALASYKNWNEKKILHARAWIWILSSSGQISHEWAQYVIFC